jgi:hypothetical protein
MTERSCVASIKSFSRRSARFARLSSLSTGSHTAAICYSHLTAPRWTDFESACLGPQGWDLTVLPDEVAASYFKDIDWDLLQRLRQRRSLCVAVWCWVDPDRAPVLRQAGTYHLSVLRGLNGS